MRALIHPLNTMFNRLFGSKSWQYSALNHSSDDLSSLIQRFRSIQLRSVAIFSACAIALLGIVYWFSGNAVPVSTYRSACSAEKHLVIASTGSQNVSWMADIPSDWTIKRYMMDDPKPDPSVGLSVPRLYGREAMAYMTYIIDHYECLPSYAIFLHGHERSWHQIAPISAKVRALNLTALSQEQYISFRCEDNMGCERLPYIDVSHPNWDGENHMGEFFRHVLPGKRSPQYVSYKCCGQHAVTAAAMRHLSKAEWVHVREPLFRDEDEMEANESWARDPKVTEWLLGAWYEKYWHVFFGMSSQHCPSLEQCRQVHFSNAIICDGDTDLVPYEGDTWKEVQCRTAFDGVPRDEAPNWHEWYVGIPSLSARMREDRATRVKAKMDRLHELEQQFAKSNQ